MNTNEDEISQTNTADSLLSSRNSSETISSNNDREAHCCQLKNKKRKCVPSCYIVLAVVSIAWAVFTVILTPFQALMGERLRMTPGLPPYEWWKNPPDQVLFRAYVFNVTNSEEFLNNKSVELNFAEVGPLVYMEKLVHNNITFNDNSTLSYVATRKAVFLPEQNTIDLDATVIVPNWALLGMASYLWDESFFVKFGFNLLVRSTKPQPFLKVTVRDLLWNFSDPIVGAAQKMAPSMVPMTNLGVLSRIYTNFENLVTVFIGRKHGHDKFFLIDKYDGSSNLPNWHDTCAEKVTGSTEGVCYPQYLTPDTKIKYWRNTLCKSAVLTHQSNLTKYGVDVYRFTLPNTTFDRTEPAESDCFKSEPVLPNGLSDVSKCHFGFPLAASFPHFLYSGDSINAHVTGLSPNESRHESFVIIEPITGVPLESRARSQCNLVVRNLGGFHENVTRFSGIVIPMFWLEYNQTGLPWYISSLIYFQVKVLPVLQWFFTAFLFIAGAVFIYFYVRGTKGARLARNTALAFEREQFLNKV